jgi:hypothetical protein
LRNFTCSKLQPLDPTSDELLEVTEVICKSVWFRGPDGKHFPQKHATQNTHSMIKVAAIVNMSICLLNFKFVTTCPIRFESYRISRSCLYKSYMDHKKSCKIILTPCCSQLGVD